MRIHRSLLVAGALAALVSPMAAFAQTVTTDPLAQAAPALSFPLLVVAAMALIGLGVYSTRTRAGRGIVGFTLVAGLSLITGVIYANSGVIIDGAECKKETVSPYDSSALDVTLTSLCPNRIKIVAIDPDCGMLITPQSYCVGVQLQPPCTVGQILANGDTCTLPSCNLTPCE